jgi:hypothetical protein
MRLLLNPGYGDVTFWYQSSGCYSKDRNIDMVLKFVSGWLEQGKEPGLIHPQFGEVIRVFIMKVIQTGIPWQTPPLMYLQHQYTLKETSQ